MKIAVVGGAGYIGTHVVHELLEQGHNIVVLDNFSTGDRINIVQGYPADRYHLIEGDFENPASLDRLFEHNPDVLFHFAASKAAGESMTDPCKYSKNNIRHTAYLLERISQSSCKNIVFSSTAAVYGEPQYLPLDEKHPCNPINYYGFTKKLIEDNMEWFRKIFNINYAVLRYFNAAGYDVKGRVKGLEKDPANLLPVVMEVLSGQRKSMDVFGNDYPTSDGTCVRDYIHVNDLATAHVKAMDYIAAKKESLLVNLGTGSGLSVKEIIDAAEKVAGKKVTCNMAGRRAGDPAIVIAGSQKAEKMLGWKAVHSDAETLLRTMWNLYKR